MFLRFSFERDVSSSLFISPKDEFSQEFMSKLEDGEVDGRPWLNCRWSFWLSKSDIFRCIRFKIADGFLFPKYGSSTLVQPFFLPGISIPEN